MDECSFEANKLMANSQFSLNNPFLMGTTFFKSLIFDSNCWKVDSTGSKAYILQAGMI